MTSYTKGPWLYRGKSDSVHTACDTHPYGPYLFSFKEESAPTGEDLAVILAAPEMLETLKAIRDAEWRGWEELASPEEFVRWAKSRANHAISKATGESA